MSKKYEYWSIKELEFLKKNYRNGMTVRKISEKLGRTSHAVRRKAI